MNDMATTLVASHISQFHASKTIFNLVSERSLHWLCIEFHFSNFMLHHSARYNYFSVPTQLILLDHYSSTAVVYTQIW